MPSSAVFDKWKTGVLHSGSKNGPVVKSRQQAIAIYLSEKRKEAQNGGKYPERAGGGNIETLPIEPTGQAGRPTFDEVSLGRAMGLPRLGPRDAAIINQLLLQSSRGAPGPRGFAFGGMPAGFGAAPIAPPMVPAGMAQPMGMPGLGGMQNAPMGLAGRPMGYAYGGVPVYSPTGLSPGWVARQEARNMTHVGPIVSTVAGRTDHHPMSVPSGSYVLPAAHVSALGQGNTLAGMKVLHGMFGSPMSMKRGPGAPRSPSPFKQQSGLGGIKLPKSLSSEGGLRGEADTGEPVPIMAAGGEFVLSPDQVAKVGGGDVSHGHAILDAWVEKTHKKYAKTIANLPPPAKD